MRIGLFGGAFNPVHSGHINLAKSYIKELGLDKIIFIPTANPPHKSNDDFALADDRVNMLKLGVSGIDNAVVSDIEFHLNGKSYTYNTVIKLKEEYPNDEFFLIIGADQFLNFKSWYRYEDLLKMVTLCTAARENEQYMQLVNFAKDDPIISNSKYVVLNIDVYVVSSSQIRDLVKQNKSIENLVPKQIEKYIRDNELYV